MCKSIQKHHIVSQAIILYTYSSFRKKKHTMSHVWSNTGITHVPLRNRICIKLPSHLLWALKVAGERRATRSEWVQSQRGPHVFVSWWCDPQISRINQSIVWNGSSAFGLTRYTWYRDDPKNCWSQLCGPAGYLSSICLTSISPLDVLTSMSAKARSLHTHINIHICLSICKSIHVLTCINYMSGSIYLSI